MAKKVKRRRPIQALDIYTNAMCWAYSTMALKDQSAKDIYQYPVAVAEAFSLELFLKTLYRLRRRNAWGHNLKTLFEHLGQRDRRTLTRYYDELIENHNLYPWAMSKGLLMDLESVLQRSKDAFTIIRYWHEGIPPDVDSQGHAGNAGVSTLIAALIRLIGELRPEWEFIAIRATMERGDSQPT